MKPNKEIDAILATIDAMVPPEQHPVTEEVSGLLLPQFTLIAAVGALELHTNHHLEFDSHHLFWPRAAYATRLQKQFRRQFVIPINRAVHEEIHAQLEPPPMPQRAVMLGYLALLDAKEGQLKPR